jgi:hypothetical protein
VTCVALIAVTVKVDEFPAVISVGLAVTNTVGTAIETSLEPLSFVESHPLKNEESKRHGIAQ